MIVWSTVLYSSLEDLVHRCEEQKKKCQKRWLLKTPLKLRMTKELFRKEVKWKRIKRCSPLWDSHTGRPQRSKSTIWLLQNPRWRLATFFFDIKAQHNLLLLYIVIKTVVLQTLQTLSFLKLTQSFGKMSLSAAAHFLIYVGTPCSCHIPEKILGA